MITTEASTHQPLDIIDEAHHHRPYSVLLCSLYLDGCIRDVTVQPYLYDDKHASVLYFRLCMRLCSEMESKAIRFVF